eukprot:COSAG01_NODE_13281_length_1607_cov_3.791114_2_plen_119_part_00
MIDIHLLDARPRLEHALRQGHVAAPGGVAQATVAVLVVHTMATLHVKLGALEGSELPSALREQVAGNSRLLHPSRFLGLRPGGWLRELQLPAAACLRWLGRGCRGGAACLAGAGGRLA